MSFRNSLDAILIRRVAAAATAAALVIALAPLALAQAGGAGSRPDREVIELTVDVAEDLNGKFVSTFVKPEDTQPERGSFFVSEGRVFPAGTIQGDGADFDPYQRGHIGVWIVRGTHLVPAAAIPAADWWVTTAQLFVLGRQGVDQIASEGLESSETITRIVSGGTGNFAGWVGEQRQTFLGVNSTGGVNLRVTFILRKAVR
jgi:hypothetical protein